MKQQERVHSDRSPSEGRVQRLEEGQTEVMSQLSAQTVQLEYLTKGLDGLDDKFDNGIRTLAQKLEAFGESFGFKLEAIGRTVEDHGRQISDGKRTRAAVRKWVAASMLIVSGAVFTKFGESIYTFLVR